MLSYLVNRANALLVANVFFSGISSQAAGTSGPIPFTGFPPPDDLTYLAWIIITNGDAPGGQDFYVRTQNSPTASSGILLKPGETYKFEQPMLFNARQSINGQLWPFGGTSAPIVDNIAGALPAVIVATWGGVE